MEHRRKRSVKQSGDVVDVPEHEPQDGDGDDIRCNDLSMTRVRLVQQYTSLQTIAVGIPQQQVTDDDDGEHQQQLDANVSVESRMWQTMENDISKTEEPDNQRNGGDNADIPAADGEDASDDEVVYDGVVFDDVDSEIADRLYEHDDKMKYRGIAISDDENDHSDDDDDNDDAMK